MIGTSIVFHRAMPLTAKKLAWFSALACLVMWLVAANTGPTPARARTSPSAPVRVAPNCAGGCNLPPVRPTLPTLPTGRPT